MSPVKPVSPPAWRLAGRLLGGLATLGCVGFLVWLTRARWAELPAVRWTPELAVALLGALGLYVAGLALGALAWRLLLGGQRRRLPPATAVALLLRTGVAKYLPGNVGHLLGRAVLARRLDLSTTVVVASLVLEAATAAVVALGLGAAGLLVDRPVWTAALSHLPEIGLRLPSPGRVATGAAVLGAVGLGAWLLPRLLRRRLGNRAPRELGIGPRAWAGALGFHLGSFVLYGWMVWLVIESGFGTGSAGASDLVLAEATWLRAAVAFALAWVIGFLTPGSPGGLGVRETVLVLLLTPMTGPARALVLALGLRVLTVVGDGVGFLLSFARRLTPVGTSTEE